MAAPEYMKDLRKSSQLGFGVYSWLQYLDMMCQKYNNNNNNNKWFIIVTCAYIYTIIYNYIYKHIKSTRPYGPISHQINKYMN